MLLGEWCGWMQRAYTADRNCADWSMARAPGPSDRWQMTYAERMRMVRTVCVSGFVLAVVSAGGVLAQGLNNQPYDFGGRGLGMSSAGKQAILSDQVLGIRPDNLIIGPGGVLLYADKGPGGSAIVYDWYQVPVPGYRGRGWRGNWNNAGYTNRLFYVERMSGSGATATALNTWTSMIGDDDSAFGDYLLPVGINTLDLLLWQVQSLSP